MQQMAKVGNILVATKHGQRIIHQLAHGMQFGFLIGGCFYLFLGNIGCRARYTSKK